MTHFNDHKVIKHTNIAAAMINNDMIRRLNRKRLAEIWYVYKLRANLRACNLSLKVFDHSQTESFIEPNIVTFKTNFTKRWIQSHNTICRELENNCNKTSK